MLTVTISFLNSFYCVWLDNTIEDIHSEIYQGLTSAKIPIYAIKCTELCIEKHHKCYFTWTITVFWYLFTPCWWLTSLKHSYANFLRRSIQVFCKNYAIFNTFAQIIWLQCWCCCYFFRSIGDETKKKITINLNWVQCHSHHGDTWCMYPFLMRFHIRDSNALEWRKWIISNDSMDFCFYNIQSHAKKHDQWWGYWKIVKFETMHFTHGKRIYSKHNKAQ